MTVNGWVCIYIDRQIHTWQTLRHIEEHTHTAYTQCTQTERRADIKFKHKAIMSLSRFTHVSALIWNPLPHYPHSILLLIKYLLKIRWHQKYRCFISQLFFSLDFNYSYSTFGWCTVRACDKERKVNLSDFWLCVSIALACTRHIFLSILLFSACEFMFFFLRWLWFNSMTCKHTSDRINRNFLFNNQRDNHENYTICEANGAACGCGCGKIGIR